FEDRPASVRLKVDELQQVMQFLEMVLVEIVEKTARPDGVLCDFQIVDVMLPIASHFVDGRHASTILSRLMIRDVSRLTGRTFDVLVIGGGVYGLTIAYDAAQRGLSVALIERHDFGSGSSFNHLRTIHGGLRYLQSLDFARARESIRERHTLALIAPQTIQPLAFVL